MLKGILLIPMICMQESAFYFLCTRCPQCRRLKGRRKGRWGMNICRVRRPMMWRWWTRRRMRWMVPMKEWVYVL